MFTGIITDIGIVQSVTPQGDGHDRRLVIATAFDSEDIALGASIACAGVCLTVVDKGKDGTQNWFAVDVSGETLSRTLIGQWKVGTRVNLERALRAGDELGGHQVTGHVDGLATLTERREDNGSLFLQFTAPEKWQYHIAEKGSVTLDGVSLTVNRVNGNTFDINIIPHTASHTTLGNLQPGAQVHLEIDVIARYLARMLEQR